MLSAAACGGEASTGSDTTAPNVDTGASSSGVLSEAEQYPLPDIELLVVGHHGSKYSSTTEFLDAVRPETAVISVGDNTYGHPTDQALLRLVAAGCEIYRTDLQGNVLVTVEGEE